MAIYDLKVLEERKAVALEAFYKARAEVETVEQLLRNAEFEGHEIMESAGHSANQTHEELAEVPPRDSTNVKH